jgi:hypothetical protein
VPSDLPSTGTDSGLSALLLQPGDLPAGWVAEPHEDSGDPAAQQRQLAQCLGTRTDTSADRLDRQHSPDYTQGQSQIGSEVTAWKRQEDVDAQVQQLNQIGTASCLTKLLRAQVEKQLPSGATVDDFQLHLTHGSGDGPANVVATVAGTVKVTSGAQQVTVHLGAAYITGDRLTSTVQWTGVGQPIPSSVTDAATEAVADRVAAA